MFIHKKHRLQYDMFELASPIPTYSVLATELKI